ncbi:multiple sugar transport system substrate-binding protein [Nakamurella sp. UYEF19]|uniref:ABC transporter substrate-binding protein n=1 Tax=Nakamurella sp. UYEF19 TaxID=1756392 RepID=UPI003391B244
MTPPLDRRQFLLGASAIAAGSVLAACSSGSKGTAATSAGAAASGPSVAPASGGAVTTEKISLNYWAWGTPQDPFVAAWNKANPNIQVKHTDAGGGTDSSAKLLTAARAGDAPDAALVEYTTLPAMIVGNVATDITQYVSSLKGSFSEGTWGQTTFNGAIYGVPQDVGPMVLVYNEARFTQLGVKPPTTWAEFATVAEQVRKADKNTYLATFSPAEFGNFAGLSQQAGGQWWKVDGENWTVGINDDASLKVADFWQDLIDRDLVSVEALFTPEYNKQLNAGQILSWPSALWAPGVIYGAAPSQAGKWAMSRFPQWTAGDDKVAYQGGSAVVVTSSAKHPAEAAQFAAFINSSAAGAQIQLSTGQYPASVVGQQAAIKSAPPVLMPQQKDFWKLASEISAQTIPSISWGPNVNVASSTFQDAMKAAIANKTKLRDALAVTQKAVVADMAKTGFKVTG